VIAFVASPVTPFGLPLWAQSQSQHAWKKTIFIGKIQQFCPLTHGSTFPVNLLREPHKELASGCGTWVPYRPSELCIKYVIDSSQGRGIGGVAVLWAR
jgi:hypothetical protein